MEMRLGKTLVALTVMRDSYQTGMSLVVGPYSVFNGWEKDAEALRLQTFRAIGTASQRLEVLRNAMFHAQEEHVIVLLNKEAWKVIPQIQALPWRWVVTDEAHFLKNPQAAVTKFFLGGTVIKKGKGQQPIRTHYDGFPVKVKRMALTGTPRTRSDLDYFSQLRWVAPESFPDCRTYFDFRARYCRNYGFQFVLTASGKEYLKKELAKYAYALTLRQAGISKEKIRIKREVEINASFKKQYNMIVKSFILAHPDTGEELRRTKLAIECHLWLRRLCGGFVDGKFMYPNKRRVLDEVLEELGDKPVVIWAHFILEVEMLGLHLQCPVIHGAIKQAERERIIADFQDGKIRRFVAQPATIKEGVDLSTSDVEIFYTSPDNFATRAQAESRILSTSKNRPLYYIDIVVPKSVDTATLQNTMIRRTAQKAWHDLCFSMRKML